MGFATPATGSSANAESSSTTSAVANNNSGNTGENRSNKTPIGIGVGVGIGAAAILLAAAVIFVLRRRRRKQIPAVGHAELEVGPKPRWELGNNEVGGVGNNGYVGEPKTDWHTVVPYTELEGSNLGGERRG